MAKFNWKQFAGNFLQETAMNIRERKEGAKDYEEEQRQLAERNLQLVRQREAVARNAARVGKQAMDLGASKELVINAMSSGVSGVTDLYNNLQNLHSQLGYRPGQELTEDEIRMGLSAPTAANIDPSLIAADLTDLAMQTYGVVPKGKLPDPEEASTMKTLFGFDAKDRVRRELADEKYYGNLSIGDINYIAQQSEYNALVGDAVQNFAELPIYNSEAKLNFSTQLNKVMDDAITGQAFKNRLAALVDPADKQTSMLIERQKAAGNFIRNYAGTYEYTGFFDDPATLDLIKQTFEIPGQEGAGQKWLDTLLVEYDREPETPISEDDTSLKIKEPVPPKKVDLKKDPVDPVETDDPFPPAPDLDEEGRAIMDASVSGELRKGYTAQYTREQWNKMSRKQREERDLPVSPMGVIGFQFKEDVDKVLEKSLSNLNIKRNTREDKEYKVIIKNLGTFTATKEQLDQMLDSAFMGERPAIILEEYGEEEPRERKLTTRIIKRFK